MEPEWMRVEHRSTLNSSSKHTRHWFSCEIPDEDEDSGDDDWCHVADVFVTFELGIINRIEIVMAHNVNELFDSAPITGHFQKVIIEELRDVLSRFLQRTRSCFKLPYVQPSTRISV